MSLFISFPKKLILFGVLCFFFGFFSCKDDESVTPEPSDGLTYFPLVKGFWIEYEVDSIYHRNDDDASLVDTSKDEFHFFVREEIDSSFMDSENQPAFKIVRYKRSVDSLPWNLASVWTARVDQYSAQRVEDNIRFIKLKFPVKSTTVWQGNAYNFFQPEEYSYDKLYESKSYNSLLFDSTITVIQNSFVSAVNRIIKTEIYGAHVGLLFKQLDSVRTANTPQGTIILNGLQFSQKITEYKR